MAMGVEGGDREVTGDEGGTKPAGEPVLPSRHRQAMSAVAVKGGGVPISARLGFASSPSQTRALASALPAQDWK